MYESYCRRYGLLGLNGCGKSTLLTAIGLREVPIPDHMDIYHLTREIDATEMTALEAVKNVDSERLVLEKEAEKLAAQVSVSSVVAVLAICNVSHELLLLHVVGAEGWSVSLFRTMVVENHWSGYTRDWRVWTLQQLRCALLRFYMV